MNYNNELNAYGKGYINLMFQKTKKNKHNHNCQPYFSKKLNMPQLLNSPMTKNLGHN